MKTKVIFTVILAVVLGACTKDKATDSNRKKADATKPDGIVVEGVINGGGGKGVLCDKNGPNARLEILDIYEGKHVYGLKFDKLKDKDFETVKEETQKRFDHFTQYPKGMDVEQEEDDDYKGQDDSINILLEEATFTKKGQSLKSTSDSDEAFVASNCELVQIAVYYDETVLLIDSKYWDMLDDFNKLALLAHEQVYAYKRLLGAKNSISSRRFISHLLADRDLEPRLGQALVKAKEGEYLLCNSKENSKDQVQFFLLKSEGRISLVMDTVGWSPVLFSTSGQFSKNYNIPLEFFSETSISEDASVDLSAHITLKSSLSRLEYGFATINSKDGSLFFQLDILGRDRRKFEAEVSCDENVTSWSKGANKDIEDTENFKHTYFGGEFIDNSSGWTIKISADGNTIKSTYGRVWNDNNWGCLVEMTSSFVKVINDPNFSNEINTGPGDQTSKTSLYLELNPQNIDYNQAAQATFNEDKHHQYCTRKTQEENKSISDSILYSFLPIDEDSFYLSQTLYTRKKSN